MTIPAVGVTHHVKIGDYLCLVRPGSYRKRPAPLFGARFSTGDPSWTNLTMWQHWAQTCWIGGMIAETWIDDSMFDTAVGVDTTGHEVARLARELSRPNASWALSGTRNHHFCAVGGKVFCLSMGHLGSELGRLYVLDGVAQTWSEVGSGFEDGISICSVNGYVVLGTAGGTIARIHPATSVNTPFAKPVGITAAPHSITIYGEYAYFAFAADIWRLSLATWTWDASTPFYHSSSVNGFVGGEVHLGYLYLLGQNGHLLRTDGNNTFDLWQWDEGVNCLALRSFDGQLYVFTWEHRPAVAGDGAGTGLDGTPMGGAQVYRFSGSAVTELKRWGVKGATCQTGRPAIYGGKLWYGAGSLFGFDGGFGVVCYDATEDAHSIFAVNRDVATYPAATDWLTGALGWVIDDIVFFGEFMLVATQHHGVFQTHVASRDEIDGSATYLADVDGWLVSSDFDGGTPGLVKFWRQATLYADMPSGTAVSLEYSIDRGVTWTVCGSPKVSSVEGSRSCLVFSVGVRSVRLQYRLKLSTTDPALTPAVYGVVFSYLPQPEPNWMWEMTVVASEKVALLDKSVVPQAADSLRLALEGYYRSQDLVDFIEVDGKEWPGGVLVYDITVDVPIPVSSGEGPVESEVRVVLVEAVETPVVG